MASLTQFCLSNLFTGERFSTCGRSLFQQEMLHMYRLSLLQVCLQICQRVKVTNSAHIRTQRKLCLLWHATSSVILPTFLKSCFRKDECYCLFIELQNLFFFQSLSEIKKNHYGTCIHGSRITKYVFKSLHTSNSH